MNQSIGKYRIYEDDKMFKIHYRYSFNDMIGSIWFVLSLALGLLLLLVSISTFKQESFVSWIIILTALYLSGFGTYFLIAGFYNPGKGVFQIDKISKAIF